MNEFSPDRPDSTNPAAGVPRRDRRPLRLLLIGNHADVLETIQSLHKGGFTEINEWSVPMGYPLTEAIDCFIPAGLPNAVVSVYTKYLG